jgi:SAM-dependent methyltransferase
MKSKIMGAYDRVAGRYADQFGDELKHKPLDRALLDCFAEQVRGRGTVADVGCGPGHIAAYLCQRGLPMIGIDLSETMVAHARQAVPGVEFRTGDMLNLDVEEESWAGIVAFYSIVHLEPEEILIVAREFYRALRPGGQLLLSFHAGDERIHIRDWFGQAVDIEWVFFAPGFLEQQLQDARLVVDASILRAPYASIEHPSRRAYLLAHRPA